MRHYFSLPKEGVIFQDSKRPGKKKCPHFPWQTACCVLQVADRQIETEFFFSFSFLRGFLVFLPTKPSVRLCKMKGTVVELAVTEPSRV